MGSPGWRWGLQEQPKLTQVTTFDEPAPRAGWNGDRSEYVLQCVPSCDGTMLAASLSNLQIKLYHRQTLAPERTLKGHSGAVTDVCCSPQDPNTLASTCEDAMVRLWDIRAAGEPALSLRSAEDCEALCCSLGLDGTLLATGVGAGVFFYDLRKPSAHIGSYVDAHLEDVTKLMFHPTRPTCLASGGEDGLVCIYDTAVSSAEEALTCIINADCPVRHLMFFGPEMDGLAVLTGTEGLNVWHWPSAHKMLEYNDVRQAVNQALGSDVVSYALQCCYDVERDTLILATGSIDGLAVLSAVQPDGLQKLAQLGGRGGHRGVVRCMDYSPTSIVTGGEDARLCIWRTGQTARSSQPCGPSAAQHEPVKHMTTAKLRKQHRRPY